MAYEFNDSDYELLGAIAICTTHQEKTRLIRSLCDGKPIPYTKGLRRSIHNDQINWLHKNFPGWNDPIPD